MQLNLNFDGTVSAQAQQVCNAVARFITAEFTDNITININVTFGAIAGLGTSNYNLNTYTYAQVRSALVGDARSADDVNGTSFLPVADPIAASHTYTTTSAEARALGLADASASDGTVTFSNTETFDYNRHDGITAGAYDFYGIVAHELTEIMGRQLNSIGNNVAFGAGYHPLDLFRFSGLGTRDFVGTDAGYLSADGGLTSIGAFNTDPNGDFGDWANSVGADAFRAFSDPAVINGFTSNDLRAMDLIGFDRYAATATFNPTATSTIPANDDGSSPLVDISSVFQNGIFFAGQTYTGLYVNNNGNITFGSGLSTYTPSQIGGSSGLAIIAPFWADVDTRGAGAHLVSYGLDTVHHSFVATWDTVDYYNVTVSGHVSKFDTFQLELRDLGNGDFDIVFRYGNLNWTTGDASSGSGGLGGTIARAGFSTGDGITYFELPQSGSQSQMLALNTIQGNTGVAGVWEFAVQNGVIAGVGTGSADNLTGDSGPNYMDGGLGDDTLSGGDGNDTLVGGGGNDKLFGQNGDDLLIGGTGADSLDGGAGVNTAGYGTAATGVTVNMGNMTLNTGDAVGDTFTNIQNLLGSGFNDVLTGNASANAIDGGVGDDTLDGGAGDDTLYGSAGNDILNDTGGGNDVLFGGDGNDTLTGGTQTGAGYNSLYGGNGTDTASYATNAAVIYANIAAGGTFVGGVLTDLFNSIENLIGGTNNDLLVGDGANNRIEGGAGNDQIYGGTGNDTLVGGTHAAGSFNQLFGEGGSDTVDYSAETGKVFVDLRAPAGSIDNGAGYVLNDLMNSVENAIGGSNTDTLVGDDANANLLDGRAGADVLFGLGGDDTLIGGTAPSGQYNQLWGGTGNDTASYNFATTRVYADLNVLAGWVDNGAGTLVLNDVYNSIENLAGGSAGDSLVGDAGANVIYGGGGADILYANTGASFDASIDRFVYTAATDSNFAGYDTIVNFKTGQDVIDLSAFGINSSKVLINSSGGSTSIYADVDGVAGYDLAIVALGTNAVAVSDIKFV